MEKRRELEARLAAFGMDLDTCLEASTCPEDLQIDCLSDMTDAEIQNWIDQSYYGRF